MTSFRASRRPPSGENMIKSHSFVECHTNRQLQDFRAGDIGRGYSVDIANAHRRIGSPHPVRLDFSWCVSWEVAILPYGFHLGSDRPIER